MADDQKQQDDTLLPDSNDSQMAAPSDSASDEPASQEPDQDQIFRDLLSETRIAPLQIREPEFDSFDVQSVIQEAKATTKSSSRSLNPFGKRSRKNKAKPAGIVEERFFTPKAAAPSKDGEYTSAAQAIAQNTTQNQEDPSAQPRQTLSATPAAVAPVQTKPRTFAEILNSTRYRENQQAIETLDEALESQPEPDQASLPESDKTSAESSRLSADKLESSNIPKASQAENEPASALEVQSVQKELGLSQDEAQELNYEEYEDKKHFSTTDYKKIEEYLASESAKGFHFLRADGSTYYFAKSSPRPYYYRVLYFGTDPGEQYWQDLETLGWKKMDIIPSRHKRDAGWTIVRNEKHTETELPKEIDNEEEKYRYFTKLSSSCRSTMFLLLFVMICSAAAIFLQYYFKGYMAVIIASGILFAVALWMFLVYARMLSKSRKQASLLSARMRLAENDPGYQALRQAGQSSAYAEESAKGEPETPSQNVLADESEAFTSKEREAKDLASAFDSQPASSEEPAASLDEELEPPAEKSDIPEDSRVRRQKKKDRKKQKKEARKSKRETQ